MYQVPAHNTVHPQENAIAERINKNDYELSKSSALAQPSPPTYFEDAFRDANFKYNLNNHHAVRNIPYTLWHRHPPKLDNAFIFGQLRKMPILKTPKPELRYNSERKRHGT